MARVPIQQACPRGLCFDRRRLSDVLNLLSSFVNRNSNIVHRGGDDLLLLLWRYNVAARLTLGLRSFLYFFIAVLRRFLVLAGIGPKRFRRHRHERRSGLRPVTLRHLLLLHRGYPASGWLARVNIREAGTILRHGRSLWLGRDKINLLHWPRRHVRQVRRSWCVLYRCCGLLLLLFNKAILQDVLL